jgi:hypothetical protein
MLMALGAANPPGRAFPRYSVDSGGGELKITDNDRDELFLYNSSHDEQGMPSYRLRGVVKLIETGQAELRPKKGEK